MPSIRFKRIKAVLISIAFIACVISGYILRNNRLTYEYSTQTLDNLDSNSFNLATGDYPSIEVSQLTHKNTKQRRKGLVIVAHGKSGSSITLDIFNFNELVFAAYEPLVLTEWWEKADTTGTFNQTEAALDVITSFMTCSFSKHQHGIHFLDQYSTQWDRRLVSNMFNSPPFCDERRNKETCIDLDHKLVDRECLKRNYSVIKVMYNRLPGRNIAFFQSAIQKLNEEMDLKVLHLVRDPRGLVNSRINFGWIKDYPDSHFQSQTKEVCDLVLNNVLVTEKLSEEMKKRYMLVKYEDISHDIIKTAENMYKFAEMEMTPSIVQWLTKHVRSKRGEKWMTEASQERTALVEKLCRPLLIWLNIEPSIIERRF